ncbi:MAG: hypothetical protein NTU44_12540 [Bacteroidetes bacterium]|nr:hypothetical protein [Bacteroidota bacterium]
MRFHKVGLIMMSLLLSLSCSPQKRLAREAVDNFKPPAVLLLFPDFIFKTNSKTPDISGYASLSNDQKDSVKYFNSKFIRFTEDSTLLRIYYSSMCEELKNLGFKVLKENKLDSFLTLKEPAVVLSMVQAELEETADTALESEVFDDSLYYSRQFILNVVRLNSWFELNRLNTPGDSIKVLFSSFFVGDQVDGNFRRHPLIMDVNFKYRYMEIRLDDVYGLADFSGKKNAGYLFDLLLNNYINTRYPDAFRPGTYWHYNRFNNRLKPTSDDRFTIIDN